MAKFAQSSVETQYPKRMFGLIGGFWTA